MFFTKQRRARNRNGIRLPLKRLSQHVGAPRVYTHVFRHAFGVGYLGADGPEANLQKILGHSRRLMVDNYVRLAGEHRLSFTGDIDILEEVARPLGDLAR